MMLCRIKKGDEFVKMKLTGWNRLGWIRKDEIEKMKKKGWICKDEINRVKNLG